MRTSQTIEKENFGKQFHRESDEVYESCFAHPAIATLRSFNRNFASRSLTRSELLLFLASMATFNRHTIGGIAILEEVTSGLD